MNFYPLFILLGIGLHHPTTDAAASKPTPADALACARRHHNLPVVYYQSERAEEAHIERTSSFSVFMRKLSRSAR